MMQANLLRNGCAGGSFLLGIRVDCPAGRCKLMGRSATSETDYLGFDK